MAGAPRFVPDTNVCLDLFVFDDPQCMSLLAAVDAGEVELVTRDDCRAEWLAVLEYPQLKLDEPQRMRAIELFGRYVLCMPWPAGGAGSFAKLPRCRDRDDQKFLELALQARAAALLTRDDELLYLARRTLRDGLFAILRPALWRLAIP
ncbi:putative toxin-antitoxin system toxin component, PIN family [Dyella choica]|uniref:Putative toxin-antitoxin system toxin component, PIN family n=1 Tax=Dyella choica TaxID=1927959 RepID=A0A432M1S9_9GAMM|nr:putative toxin-antitoxin system toxin component, PIN family [Dyella choica]RUL71475.1 putative toxin-antitoxin system toxin component, PIN family [Dyella choica]